MRASLLVALVLIGCDSNIKPPTNNNNGDDTASGPAQLVVSVTEVEFGEVSYGELLSATVLLSNPGSADLVISSITVEAPFQVSPADDRIIGGGVGSITLFVQPTSYADFSSNLTMVTDDASIGTVNIPLHAVTISDEDGDGFDVIAAGGTDCDDTEADVNPDATEEWYDGVDQNCDGSNDYDRDGDGYEAETDDHIPRGEVDCIDTDAAFHPGADDEPYDNRDTDCDGGNDWDYDRDGYESLARGRGSDCDDYDASVNRNGVEAFNGKDDDCNGETDDGALVEYADYAYNADGTWDRTGYSVALGDVTGDGIAELFVGAPYVDATNGSAAGRGGVAMFEGPDLLESGTDINRADNWFTGDNTTDLLGNYVTVLGDFDGDGLNDLAVSATGYSSNTGAVYILSGDDARRGDLGDAMATYTGNASSAFGRGIGTDIDLNADGMQELVVMYASGTANYVALEYGSATPTSNAVTLMDAKWSTDGAEVAFYRNAAVGGDLDGDGYQDLVLADGKADYGGYTDNGAMWVLWGQATEYVATSTADLEATATTAIRGSASSDYSAWSVALGDDADGDGDAELWVYNADDGIYVVPGGLARRSVFDPATASGVTHYAWNASTPDAEMIRRAGDWDGDGVSEMLVFIEDQSGSYGLSELFPGSNAAGTYQERDALLGSLTGSTDYTNGNVGYGMAPRAGDVDGDGDDDLAVGDAEYGTNKGQAYVLLNRMND